MLTKEGLEQAHRQGYNAKPRDINPYDNPALRDAWYWGQHRKALDQTLNPYPRLRAGLRTALAICASVVALVALYNGWLS